MKLDKRTARVLGSRDSRRCKRVANVVRKVLQKGHALYPNMLKHGNDLREMRKLYRRTVQAAKRYSNGEMK